jgi:nuclear pore complex protein Nup107
LSNDKGYEAELVQDLRTLYIPYLIIQLHSIYVEGESVNSDLLIEALELTNLVANETTKFYLLFQNCDRLKEYLKLVAQCAALAAGKNL